MTAKKLKQRGWNIKFGFWLFGLATVVLCFIIVAFAWSLFADNNGFDFGTLVKHLAALGSLLVLIFFVGDKFRSTMLDLSDSHDIKLVIDDLLTEREAEGLKPYLGNEFRQQIWNQINRRAEKEKIASLKNLDRRFDELKDWIKLVVPGKS